MSSPKTVNEIMRSLQELDNDSPTTSRPSLPFGTAAHLPYKSQAKANLAPPPGPGRASPAQQPLLHRADPPMQPSRSPPQPMRTSHLQQPVGYPDSSFSLPAARAIPQEQPRLRRVNALRSLDAHPHNDEARVDVHAVPEKANATGAPRLVPRVSSPPQQIHANPVQRNVGHPISLVQEAQQQLHLYRANAMRHLDAPPHSIYGSQKLPRNEGTINLHTNTGGDAMLQELFETAGQANNARNDDEVNPFFHARRENGHGALPRYPLPVMNPFQKRQTAGGRRRKGGRNKEYEFFAKHGNKMSKSKFNNWFNEGTPSTASEGAPPQPVPNWLKLQRACAAAGRAAYNAARSPGRFGGMQRNAFAQGSQGYPPGGPQQVDDVRRLRRQRAIRGMSAPGLDIGEERYAEQKWE